MKKKSKGNFLKSLVRAAAGAEILAAALIFFLQKTSFIV
jgi:hypothetical protein